MLLALAALVAATTLSAVAPSPSCCGGETSPSLPARQKQSDRHRNRQPPPPPSEREQTRLQLKHRRRLLESSAAELCKRHPRHCKESQNGYHSLRSDKKNRTPKPTRQKESGTSSNVHVCKSALSASAPSGVAHTTCLASEAEVQAAAFDPMLCIPDLRPQCPPWGLAANRTAHARFPEEGVTLAYDAPLGPDYRALAVRERLFRRIIAKLYAANVINSSHNIIEAGMAVGDNAIPWASLLTRLAGPLARPGIVYAIDPMLRNCQRTARLARVNGLSNVCLLQRAVGAATGCARIKQRKGLPLQLPQVALDQLDRLVAGRLSKVGLIHLDVEGHEQIAVKGALHLLAAHRPVLVTERHTGDTFNDSFVLQHRYVVRNIPEICGPNLSCRNRLWLPQEKVQEAMVAIASELKRSLQPEVSPTLTGTGQFPSDGAGAQHTFTEPVTGGWGD